MEKKDGAVQNQRVSQPGETIRAQRKKLAMTLSDLSGRTGLAVSTLSKIEKGQVSLSYDKLMLVAQGLGVDMAMLIQPSHGSVVSTAGSRGRRVVQRVGEGQIIETHSYHQVYLATEILNKQFTPLLGEAKLRTIDAFMAEFGDWIRHPGEEFMLVLEGVIELHTELYAPVRLNAGDSVYFDSDMGHAYIKGADGPCRSVAMCSSRGEEQIIEQMINAAERRAAEQTSAPPRVRRSRA
jgi:transcriptional regulator with XRE-family HTH domain